MNLGKVVLSLCVLLALVLVVGFVIVVGGPGGVTTDAGTTTCAPSRTSGRELFGLDVTNDSDRAVTLESVAASSSVGIRAVRYWALAPVGLGPGERLGTGTPSDAPGWSTHRSVAGAPIPPHRAVVVVVEPVLVAGASTGYVRDFTVTTTPSGGISHTQTAAVTFGFARPGTDGATKDCG